MPGLNWMIFELIANRYIANQALNDAAEKRGYREYAQEKFNTYQEQKKNPQLTCSEVLIPLIPCRFLKRLCMRTGPLKRRTEKSLRRGNL